MNIDQRTLSWGQPPYVIAEIGVNHDGSPARAIALTHAAADAGADAVKLQLFEADRLMSKAAKLAAYQQAAGERDPIEMLRRLELPIQAMAGVVDAAHARGVHSIVSVFSVELIPEAERLEWDAYKTASPDIINKPLLDALAATGKPMIVSTGTATLEEVSRALGWLHAADADDRLAVLQCVSSYPTPMELAALDGIGAIGSIFDGPVGYSDHTREDSTGALAVGAGACVLEKHLTYDRDASGPDHAASLMPSELKRYIELSRQRWSELREAGLVPPRVGEKRVSAVERDVRQVSRQSIVTSRSRPAGHRLTRQDLTIKRPGTGLEPWRLDEVIGRSLTREIEADVPLQAQDLEPARAHAPA
jgi:N,N'-diacetyllegionaminate synthase